MDTNEVFAIINERLKLSDPMGASLDSCVSVTELLSILSNAPTIDPESLRPHGKWVGEGMDARCGHCGEHPLKDMDGDSVWYWSYKPMFCPNCGAKMNDIEEDGFDAGEDWESDRCYECGAYGDDYSTDENGELVSNCDSCPYNPMNQEE